MQAVKDSFYMALQDRLAKTQQAEGSPATELLVYENQRCAWLANADTFYLRWTGETKLPADAHGAGWRAHCCEIGYRAQGTEMNAGEDRGRLLASLDAQLLAISAPRQTALLDYAQDPPTAFNALILWTTPVLNDAQEKLNGIQRTAEVTVLWREDEVQA
jgi:hypothetical protein